MGPAFLSRYRCVTRAVLIFAGVLGVASDHGYAADYPRRTISIIVPFSAGGSTDVQARLIAKGLSERLGKPVVVVALERGAALPQALPRARRPTDTHCSSARLELWSLTLCCTPTWVTILSVIFCQSPSLPEAPFVLVVSSSSPVRSLSDLLVYARKPSVNLTYATPGPGTVNHLVTEMFKASAKVQATHVPYTGAAPALTDLLGGQVSMMFTTLQSAGSQIRSEKLRALGVTGSDRVAALPEVPTFAEVGLQRVDLQTWYAVVAPAKTPAEIIARLHKEITAVAKSPEFIRSATTDGAVVIASSQQGLAKRIRSDFESVQRLIKETNFKVEE